MRLNSKLEAAMIFSYLFIIITILQYLKKQDDDLASLYRDAFDDLFKHGQTQQLEILVLKILKPYGELLWDGYHDLAPKAWRKSH
jgi:hypothetical protein